MTTTLASPLQPLVELIQSRKPNFTPQLGIILGSGLASFADHITDATTLPYSQLPGFPASTVAGHPGKLILGKLQGLSIACLQGRTHWYENPDPAAMRTLIYTLKALGCHSVLITNASGSLNPAVGPGQLMLITDHINFQGRNPLIGLHDETFGPRFLAMSDAYDLAYRERLLQLAEKLKIPLAQGIYIGVLGPTFETPAEIRAFRILGADAVGMSTVPDVILARHCGMRVALIAAITNYASGMSDEVISHELTLKYGKQAAENVIRLIMAFAESIT